MSVSSLSSLSSDSGAEESVKVVGRRTVLFPAGTSWPSSAEFYEVCRERLTEVYGVGMHRHNLSSIRAVAGCQRRKAKECRFRIVAIKEENGWTLQEDECRWEHSHDAYSAQNPSPMLAPAKPTHSGLWEEDNSDEAATSSSALQMQKDDQIGDELGEDFSKVSSPATSPFPLSGASSSKPVPQLNVPGMPQPGDRFSSFNDVHLTAVKGIVPVYGTSVHAYSVTANSGFIKCNRRNAYWKSSPEGMCPFSLSVKRDPSSGTWSTQADGSYSEHNHGPARELLADPSWLPTIVNEDARAALGLPPGKRARAKMKEEKGDKRKKKKQKRTVKLKKPVEQPSTSTSFSSSAHPSSSLPKTPAAHHQQPPFQAPQHPFQSQQPLHPPPFPPQPHPALSPSSPPKPSSSWSTSDLSAFLSSIHPSVSPLAPNFLAAGVNSFDNLVSLSLMEPETLRSFIDVVSRQGDGGTGGISALQAKLLVKESRMAGGS